MTPITLNFDNGNVLNCYRALFQKENKEKKNNCISKNIVTETIFEGFVSRIIPIKSIEPRCEKTGLRVFRPGQTQTGLPRS